MLDNYYKHSQGTAGFDLVKRTQSKAVFANHFCHAAHSTLTLPTMSTLRVTQTDSLSGTAILVQWFKPA